MSERRRRGWPYSLSERSLEDDDILTESVTTHLPVARPVDARVTRTEDGIHPNAAGHVFIAERVRAWFEQGEWRE